MGSVVQVRVAEPGDWAAIWQIIRAVAGDETTFAMDSAPDEDEMRAAWMVPSPGRAVVAVGDDGGVVGTANMYANRTNQGSHVASGSFMVSDEARGRGVGRALVRDMIEWATTRGFLGIQFNAVVATNQPAVHLYRSEGFRVVGSAPGAFRHPGLGLVDLLVMWRDLR